MRVNLLLQLKTDQSLSQERKKSCLKLSRRKILTFQQDKKKLSLKVQKGERTIYISVTTEMVRKPKQFLKKKVTKEAVNQVVEVGAPVTHVGDEEGVAPVADAKPRVVIEDEEIPFTTITRETDALPKGETRVVTEGVKGRRSHFYSVSTAADGSEVKTLVTSVVAQEPVTQIIEIGTPVTHVGDEKGLAPVAEEKPALEIPMCQLLLQKKNRIRDSK